MSFYIIVCNDPCYYLPVLFASVYSMRRLRASEVSQVEQPNEEAPFHILSIKNKNYLRPSFMKTCVI